MPGILNKMFALEQWRIGWARGDVLDFIDRPASLEFEWLVPARSHVFLADPFGDERDGRLSIYAERLQWGKPGTIVQIDAASRQERCVALEAPWHLSYPFIVEEDGARWMCPEQAEGGRVALYRINAAGGVQSGGATQIMPVGLRDSTLVWHDGRWWLFGTLDESGAQAQRLMLYHADQLVGPWHPHPMNPIGTGLADTRPAGRIIQRAGKLFRPAQDSTETYGGALVINEIVTLTPADYREQLLRRILPSEVAGAGADGLHHVDHTRSYVLIDSKVFRWHALAWLYKLREKRRRRLLGAGKLTAASG